MATSLSIARPEDVAEPLLRPPASTGAGLPTGAANSGPRLAVVPGRRSATRYVVSITMVIAAAMGGVVFFNTKIASRQGEIDAIEAQLAEQEAIFGELRAERAALRAPARLAPIAGELGMVPAEEAAFAEVKPMIYAQQIALSGEVPDTDDDEFRTAGGDPMEQYRDAKELLERQP